MDTDNEYNDEDYSMMGEDQMPYGVLQATQEQYFPSQPIPVDGHLWGFLQPCNAALKRIDFLKMNPTYTIGRGAGNDFLLEGFKVSNRHCKFTWDSRETGDSIVTIQDFSSNGTFVNMTKVGKNKTTIIRDGNELGFGAPSAQTQNEGLEDYRYVFRFVAAGIPRDGLHAHYDLGTELGKGSFANVYKAMHRATSKWFAVKMIQAEKIKKNPANHTGPGDAKKATAFAREISILEQLSHPNICQLKETFFHDSNISLVLELVEGGDLLDYILRHEGVKEPPAKHITYQFVTPWLTSTRKVSHIGISSLRTFFLRRTTLLLSKSPTSV
jgi:serine/threonine/tyrosine protein kinase RAD53